MASVAVKKRKTKVEPVAVQSGSNKRGSSAGKSRIKEFDNQKVDDNEHDVVVQQRKDPETASIHSTTHSIAADVASLPGSIVDEPMGPPQSRPTSASQRPGTASKSGRPPSATARPGSAKNGFKPNAESSSEPKTVNGTEDNKQTSSRPTSAAKKQEVNTSRPSTANKSSKNDASNSRPPSAKRNAFMVEETPSRPASANKKAAKDENNAEAKVINGNEPTINGSHASLREKQQPATDSAVTNSNPNLQKQPESNEKKVPSSKSGSQASVRNQQVSENTNISNSKTGSQASVRNQQASENTNIPNSKAGSQVSIRNQQASENTKIPNSKAGSQVSLRNQQVSENVPNSKTGSQVSLRNRQQPAENQTANSKSGSVISVRSKEPVDNANQTGSKINLKEEINGENTPVETGDKISLPKIEQANGEMTQLTGSRSSLRNGQQTKGESSQPMGSTTSVRSNKNVTNGEQSGSVTSLRSLSEIERQNEKNESLSRRGSNISKKSVTGSIRERAGEDRRSSNNSLLAQPVTALQSSAYVPWSQAKDCLTKITEDMKKMKANHLSIVTQIEETYKNIEDDTQNQFNHFVINLRTHHNSKITMFKEVITIHRNDLSNKEEYWNSSLNSLTDKNSTLMKENRALMLYNKEEYERIEKEKVDMINELTKQLDTERAKYTADLEDAAALMQSDKSKLEEKIQSINDDHEKDIARIRENFDEDINKLKEQIDQHEKEKESWEEEKERLLKRADTVDANQEATVAAVVTTEALVTSAPPPQPQGISLEEKERLEEEATAAKVELNAVKLQYNALQERLQAVLATVATNEAIKTSADETLEKAESEAKELNAKKVELQQKLEELNNTEEKSQEVEESQEPKEDEVKEQLQADLQAELQALDEKINTNEQQLEVQKMLKEGNVAELPQLEPQVVIKTETVYVEKPVDRPVMDPAAVAAAKEQTEKLQKELDEVKANLDKSLQSQKEAERNLKEAERKVEDTVQSNQNLEKENKRLNQRMLIMMEDLKKAEAKAVMLQNSLQVVINETKSEGAAKSEHVDKDINDAEKQKDSITKEREELQEQIGKLEKQVEKEDGPKADDKDREDQLKALQAQLEDKEKLLHQAEGTVAALTMLRDGVVPDDLVVQETASASTAVFEAQIADLQDQLKDITEERDALLEKKSQLTDSVDKLQDSNQELESKIAELKQQIEELNSKLSDAAAAATATAVTAAAVTSAPAPAPAPAPVPVVAPIEVNAENLEEVEQQLAALQGQVQTLESELELERVNHASHLEELEALKEELQALKENSSDDNQETARKIESVKNNLQAEIDTKQKALDEATATIESLQNAQLKAVPIDTAKEMKQYMAKIKTLEKEKQSSNEKAAKAQNAVKELQTEVDSIKKSLAKEKSTATDLKAKNDKMRADKDKQVKEIMKKNQEKENERALQEKNKVAALEGKIKSLEVDIKTKKNDGPKVDPKMQEKMKNLQEQVANLKKNVTEEQLKYKKYEQEMKEKLKLAEDKAALKKAEKQIKDIQKQLDSTNNKLEKTQSTLAKTEEELAQLKKDYNSLDTQNKANEAEIAKLGVAAQEGLQAMEERDQLKKKVSNLETDNKTLSENFNTERLLRKKYYNIIEDMKGKIRVYCRARPLSSSEKERNNYSVIESPDEYSINVSSHKGKKEFQFDQIFMPDSSQERVFEDTYNLVQSAVDGYNVCIFAYGQTGSGKTYTMIGDGDMKYPGIAPRAFDRIFNLVKENEKKYTFKISCYMLELYNDRLLDLLAAVNSEPAKMDIKKDKNGMVRITNSNIKYAETSSELMTIFEEGSKNRHTASTKMNSESSRSHLVIGIIIESTNLATGNKINGKLSLVDLAGSERAAKTGASAAQLKEAQSINKSLSALGDVIAALSSEQSFIPYRNNKLTMLMQDSLGGNAKTLMFVNISPADYNTDETLVSLTYASRVKLITNDAKKNAESKEIARLKGIIDKLKQGETAEEEDDSAK